MIYYPVSTITNGQALNITLLGHLGALDFAWSPAGGCRELVPDADRIAG